jgi:glycosyltransferase involved in cell wall biosynthesis
VTNVLEVSVIIPAYYSHETIGSCLEALERQTFRNFEVIVVDSTPDGRTAALVRRRFPSVTLNHYGERLLPHAARNQGVVLAKGNILVFTDPDCRARPDWLGALMGAHHAGHEAVGGAIENDGGCWNTAVHMAKFSWWLPGGRAGSRPDIAAANSSYSRALWETVGPFLGTRFAGDSALNWRVRAGGRQIWFEPKAAVAHRHQSGFLRFLNERFVRGRDFGATRVERQEWSRGRCFLYLVLMPLLPFVMTWRAARYAFGSGHAITWILVSLVVLLGNAAWCGGEAVSHWEGIWKR